MKKKKIFKIISVSILLFFSSSTFSNFEKEKNKEVLCLAKTIFYEARGEPLIGKIAVAHVVLNRVKDKNYPNDICGVVHQKKQFSGVYKALDKFDEKSFSLAFEILKEKKYDFDPTEGSIFYHNISVKPSWSKEYERAVRIENHIFYKPIRKGS